jgi:hypothetical protein
MKLGQSARLWMAMAAVVSALLLAALPVAADNWGANGYASGGPGPGDVACDTTQESECIADNGTHYVYFSNVETPQYNATVDRMENVYEPIAGISMIELSSYTSSVDVGVYDGYLGVNEYAGWTQCAAPPGPGMTYGGSGRHRWCKPQHILYNLSRTGYFSTGERRRMIACHEMGHTLGLQHTTADASCMETDANTSETIRQNHEVLHLENLY